MVKQSRILFMGANPANETRVALTREVQAISDKLRESKHRELLDLRQEWEPNLRDLQTLLMRHEPSVVHFSGHGSRTGQLLFVRRDQDGEIADPDVVAGVFAVLGDDIRCVVLNACYSAAQAQAIALHVAVVVGMSDAVQDDVAIEYSAAFYEALANGRSVDKAHALGKIAIRASGLPQEQVPVLIARAGVNPAEVFVTSGQVALPNP